MLTLLLLEMRMEVLMKDGVSKFWWWNRFVTNAYHFFNRIESYDGNINHLKDCKHCCDRFDKWQKKNQESLAIEKAQKEQMVKR